LVYTQEYEHEPGQFMFGDERRATVHTQTLLSRLTQGVCVCCDELVPC
jgi:hypothetical protein